MRWNVKDKQYFKPYLTMITEKYKKIGIGPIMARLLTNRNYDYDNIKKLITDPSACLEEPTLIEGCVEAGNAIIDLISNKVKVWVFGDYDVDGLMAGYIMTKYLQGLGVDVNVYYPERKEGYGLSVQFLEKLQDDCAVITVDNGVAAIPAICYCREKGIPLIITDHHKPLIRHIDCTVCDPHLTEKGVGHHLCGAAVAWKVCQYIDNKLNRSEAWKFTPYVALGTIADVMPMTLENMIIVNVGLKMINQGFAPNVKEYCKFLGISRPVTEDIAWKVAPALNACGRLGSVDLAKRFLYHEGSKEELCKLISEIDTVNKSRKAISADAVKDAISKDYGNDAICLFDATAYPAGILGIIAGKLVETFNKPAIVYQRNKSGIWPASMRSNGLNMLPYLERTKRFGYIYDYGGHEQACGISLLPDVEMFKQVINGYVRIPLEELNKKGKSIDVDMEISLSDITSDLYQDIIKIPTDHTLFPRPIFMIRNLKVHEVYHSLNNPDNIRLTLVDNNKELYKLWAWEKGSLYKALGNPSHIDIIGTVGLGFGKESESVTFNVEDIRCYN